MRPFECTSSLPLILAPVFALTLFCASVVYNLFPELDPALMAFCTLAVLGMLSVVISGRHPHTPSCRKYDRNSTGISLVIWLLTGMLAIVAAMTWKSWMEPTCVVIIGIIIGMFHTKHERCQPDEKHVDREWVTFSRGRVHVLVALNTALLAYGILHVDVDTILDRTLLMLVILNGPLAANEMHRRSRDLPGILSYREPETSAAPHSTTSRA